MAMLVPPIFTSRVQVFQRLELNLHIVIALAKLFQQHLTELFGGGARFAACGQALDHHVDRLLSSSRTVPSMLVICAFSATQRESFSRNGAQ